MRLPDAAAISESIATWKVEHPSFAALLQRDGHLVRALGRWGFDLLRANQPALAADVFRAAVGSAPEDANLWANWGMALGQDNFLNESVSCFERSLFLLRHQPDTWLMLGVARKKLGDSAAAETAFRTALEQEPKSQPAWQLLSVLMEEKHDFAAAVACLEACVKNGGGNAAVFANLGKLHHQVGEYRASCAAYQRAVILDSANAHYRQMARRTEFLRVAIVGESLDEAIARYAKGFSAADAASEKELMELLHSSFSMLSGFGHAEAATRIGVKYNELWPATSSLLYLLKAVAGDKSVDRSPPEYIVEHFDAFAGGFEEKLVGMLSYRIPEKICAAIRCEVNSSALDVLDAGCGTGLCGPLLRPLSQKLVGVDLSSKMLEHAAQKKVYDELWCEDITTFLRGAKGGFDVIAAADLMIYFGNIESIFEGARAALKPAGLLACSTELWKGGKYQILPSGRFAHDPDYFRAVAAAAFDEVFFCETTIRLDANKPLPGNIFLFRRRESARSPS